MNNFEKRKFLDYLEKLVDFIDLDSHCFDELFNFTVDEFKFNKKRYKFDKYNNLKIHSREEKSEFKKTLIEDIKQYFKTHKPKNTILEKQCNIIKELCQLNDIEYEIFLYHAFKETNNMFNILGYSIEHNSFNTFSTEYLRLRNGKKERVVSELRKRNIIEYRGGRGDDYCVVSTVLRILDNPKCNTKEKIMSILLGEKEKSNLKLSDFNHIKEKREMVLTILRNAIEQKKKGVNILLYGAVGSGKTEFARLLANRVKVPMYAVKTEKENLKEAEREERLADLYLKQGILSHLGEACILFDEAEDVLNRGFSYFGYDASKGYLNKLLENVSVPIIWTTNNIMDVDPAFLRRFKYCIEFEKLSEEARLKIWNRALTKNKLKVSKSKVEELNRNYNVSPSLIVNAIETTKMIGGNENQFEELIENVATVVYKKKNIKEKKILIWKNIISI